eukprot:gene634-383_t
MCRTSAAECSGSSPPTASSAASIEEHCGGAVCVGWVRGHANAPLVGGRQETAGRVPRHYGHFVPPPRAMNRPHTGYPASGPTGRGAAGPPSSAGHVTGRRSGTSRSAGGTAHGPDAGPTGVDAADLRATLPALFAANRVLKGFADTWPQQLAEIVFTFHVQPILSSLPPAYVTIAERLTADTCNVEPFVVKHLQPFVEGVGSLEKSRSLQKAWKSLSASPQVVSELIEKADYEALLLTLCRLEHFVCCEAAILAEHAVRMGEDTRQASRTRVIQELSKDRVTSVYRLGYLCGVLDDLRYKRTGPEDHPVVLYMKARQKATEDGLSRCVTGAKEATQPTCTNRTPTASAEAEAEAYLMAAGSVALWMKFAHTMSIVTRDLQACTTIHKGSQEITIDIPSAKHLCDTEPSQALSVSLPSTVSSHLRTTALANLSKAFQALPGSQRPLMFPPSPLPQAWQSASAHTPSPCLAGDPLASAAASAAAVIRFLRPEPSSEGQDSQSVATPALALNEFRPALSAAVYEVLEQVCRWYADVTAAPPLKGRQANPCHQSPSPSAASCFCASGQHWPPVQEPGPSLPCAPTHAPYLDSQAPLSPTTLLGTVSSLVGAYLPRPQCLLGSNPAPANSGLDTSSRISPSSSTPTDAGPPAACSLVRTLLVCANDCSVLKHVVLPRLCALLPPSENGPSTEGLCSRLESVITATVGRVVRISAQAAAPVRKNANMTEPRPWVAQSLSHFVRVLSEIVERTAGPPKLAMVSRILGGMATALIDDIGNLAAAAPHSSVHGTTMHVLAAEVSFLGTALRPCLGSDTSAAFQALVIRLADAAMASSGHGSRPGQQVQASVNQMAELFVFRRRDLVQSVALAI